MSVGSERVSKDKPAQCVRHKSGAGPTRKQSPIYDAPSAKSNRFTNGADGISDIEGKAAREAVSESGQRASFNGGNGISDIEGKVAREAMSECGQRASFNISEYSGVLSTP